MHRLESCRVGRYPPGAATAGRGVGSAGGSFSGALGGSGSRGSRQEPDSVKAYLVEAWRGGEGTHGGSLQCHMQNPHASSSRGLARPLSRTRSRPGTKAQLHAYRRVLSGRTHGPQIQPRPILENCPESHMGLSMTSTNPGSELQGSTWSTTVPRKLEQSRGELEDTRVELSPTDPVRDNAPRSPACYP